MVGELDGGGSAGFARTIGGVHVPPFLYGTAWKEAETRRLVRLELGDAKSTQKLLDMLLAMTNVKVKVVAEGSSPSK